MLHEPVCYLFYIICCVYALAPNTMPSLHPRSVNLALETSFLLSPNEMDSKIALDNLKSVIYEIEKALNINSVFRAHDKYGVTEFLKELAKIVINLEDDNSKLFAKTLKDVVKNSFYGNRKLNIQEVTKGFVVLTTVKWADIDPTAFRLKIAKYLTMDYDPTNGIIGTLNSFFNETDEVTLRNLNQKLREAGTEEEFKKIFEKIITFVLFDKFDSLDQDSKIKFQACIDDINRTIERYVKGEDLFNSRRAIDKSNIRFIDIDKYKFRNNSMLDKNETKVIEIDQDLNVIIK